MLPLRRKAHVRRRQAFSLLELVLVLALLVVLAAIVSPALDKPFAVERLRKGADQVRTEWVRTRNKAMTSGVPQIFRYQPQTGNFQIEAYGGPDAEIEAASVWAFATPKMAIAEDGATVSSSTVQQSPQTQTQTVVTGIDHGLPEGVVFEASEASIHSRSGIIGAEATAQDGLSQPVFFYPDGTSSNARLLLRNETGLYMLLQLRGLTGVVTVSDVLSADEVQ